MGDLGLAAQQQAAPDALVQDVPQSSAIEGEQLDAQQVRSFLAARLGLETAGLPEPGRRAEGPAELALDAAQRFDAPPGVSLRGMRRCSGWGARRAPHHRRRVAR